MLRNQLTVREIEEGTYLVPKYDAFGLVPVVTSCADTSEVLMLAYMNSEALKMTISSGEAHYWSRSRNELWHKGATSGQIQKVVELRIDCDQDAIWLRVLPTGDGGSCHVGFNSCFFRSLSIGGENLRRNDVLRSSSHSVVE